MGCSGHLIIKIGWAGNVKRRYRNVLWLRNRFQQHQTLFWVFPFLFRFLPEILKHILLRVALLPLCLRLLRIFRNLCGRTLKSTSNTWWRASFRRCRNWCTSLVFNITSGRVNWCFWIVYNVITYIEIVCIPIHMIYYRLRLKNDVVTHVVDSPIFTVWIGFSLLISNYVTVAVDHQWRVARMLGWHEYVHFFKMHPLVGSPLPIFRCTSRRWSNKLLK